MAARLHSIFAAAALLSAGLHAAPGHKARAGRDGAVKPTAIPSAAPAIPKAGDPAAAQAKPAIEASQAGPGKPKLLFGRYPNWGPYSGFDAGRIPFQYLTHILYSAYVTDAGGFLANSDPLDEANLKALIRMAHARGVKVSLSIQSGTGAAGFDAMAAGAASRARFIRNCLAAADRLEMDGLDFAWSFRAAGDADSRLLLLREMRTAMDANPRKLLLTSQVTAAERWAGQLDDEFFTLPDYLLVATSEYGGGLDRLAYPVSGLEEGLGALRYFEKRGVPGRNLVMESAFFGRSFDGARGLGSTYIGKGSGNEGCWRWKDLLVHLRSTPYRIHWDENTRSEIAIGHRETIAFNGIPSQRARGESIRGSEYAGVAALDLASDTLDTEKSLLVALYRGLRGNAKPQAASSEARQPAPPLAASEPDTMAGGLIADLITEHLAPGTRISSLPPRADLPMPSMSEAAAREGRFSLEVTLKADAYSACSLCLPSPLDLSSAYQQGYLELWVMGAEGDENFALGLTDDGANGVRRPLGVQVNSRSFALVKRGEWSRIRAPFRAFGTRGSYSNGRTSAPLFNSFNWSGVRCVSIAADPGRNKNFRIWVDQARFLRRSSVPGSQGEPGYSPANLAYDDFAKGGVR